jgi:leucyl/phenylalanyl-tRNA--protein transferase
MTVYLLDDSLVFPNPGHAEKTGLLAVGVDLRVERLLLAYKHGIFPWYSEGDPIMWFSPDPRLIIFFENLSTYIMKDMPILLKLFMKENLLGGYTGFRWAVCSSGNQCFSR